MVIGGPPSFDRVRGLREVLTATGAGIYLADHVAGPIPAETMTAVHESDEMELRVGRVGPDRDEDLKQREKEARAVVAAALRTSPERIVLMHGAAGAAGAIALEVLATTRVAQPRVMLLGAIEPTVAASVRVTAEAMGVPVEMSSVIPVTLADDVALVVLAHVDIDGRRADMGAIAELAHTGTARMLVDATLSAGALDFGVDELGADAVIAEVDRWLLGPSAVAIGWLGDAMGDGSPGRLRSMTTPFGRGALLALARSVGWLLMYVELPWALARTGDLADRLYAGLGSIDGLELIADPEAHGALAAFRVSDWEAEAAVEELSRSIFAIVEADAEADLVRASVGAWNRESEVDRFVERVTELAAHTPETLPRRPSLTVLSGAPEAPKDDGQPEMPEGE